jgi:hypothetical protein
VPRARTRESKGSRISVNFAESWSGRWKSNPTPNTAKSLKRLIYGRRLPSTTVPQSTFFPAKQVAEA